MPTEIHRYTFDSTIAFEDVEASLLLAIFAAESLHGESRDLGVVVVRTAVRQRVEQRLLDVVDIAPATVITPTARQIEDSSARAICTVVEFWLSRFSRAQRNRPL